MFFTFLRYLPGNYRGRHAGNIPEARFCAQVRWIVKIRIKTTTTGNIPEIRPGKFKIKMNN